MSYNTLETALPSRAIADKTVIRASAASATVRTPYLGSLLLR
jgi:hypothetical protein